MSLREAIELANNTPDVEKIVFDSSLKDGLIRLNAKDANGGFLGSLQITDSVTIDGTGLNITISGDANGDDRLVAGTNIADMASIGWASLWER